MQTNTKNLIMQTFLELSQKKEIDKITITDIVGSCGISRQTFYYHFQDILDVIDWAAEQQFQKALARSLRATTPEAAMREFVCLAQKQHKILYQLLNSQKRNHVENMLLQTVQTCLREIIIQSNTELPWQYADLPMAAEFYSYAIVFFLINHCGQKNVDIDLLAQQICRLLNIS